MKNFIKQYLGKFLTLVVLLNIQSSCLFLTYQPEISSIKEKFDTN